MMSRARVCQSVRAHEEPIILECAIIHVIFHCDRAPFRHMLAPEVADGPLSDG